MLEPKDTQKRDSIRTHRLTFLNKSLESIDYDFMKKGTSKTEAQVIEKSVHKPSNDKKATR